MAKRRAVTNPPSRGRSGGPTAARNASFSDVVSPRRGPRSAIARSARCRSAEDRVSGRWSLLVRKPPCRRVPAGIFGRERRIVETPSRNRSRVAFSMSSDFPFFVRRPGRRNLTTKCAKRRYANWYGLSSSSPIRRPQWHFGAVARLPIGPTRGCNQLCAVRPPYLPLRGCAGQIGNLTSISFGKEVSQPEPRFRTRSAHLEQQFTVHTVNA